MTRRHWLIVALFSISCLIAGGAVYEFIGHSAKNGFILPLLIWIGLLLVALILLVVPFVGRARNAGLRAGAEEITETLPIGVALYDSAGKIRHCNEAFRQAFPDPSLRAHFAELADAVSGGPGQSPEFTGDHEMADGQWLQLERRELANGDFVVTAQDISRIVVLEAEFRAAGNQFRQILSAAVEWIWETDVLHRFIMVRAVDTDTQSMDLRRMMGRSPAELTATGQDAYRLAAEVCMLEMAQHRRLSDVCFTLDAGNRLMRARLNGYASIR